jgi:hypothetical protein
MPRRRLNPAHWGRATVVAALLLAPSVASASHYRLEDVTFLSPEVQEGATRFGFIDTGELLRNLLTVEQRLALAGSMGVPEAELRQVAKVCELIQIDGVGPKAARLLQAAGVTSVADLAKRDPAALRDLLVAANAREAITQVDPSPEHVQAWVAGAARAAFHVTD